MFARLEGRALLAAQPPRSGRMPARAGRMRRGERQDENEPEGNFAVEVVEAKFPEDQKLAKSSDLVVTVRNAGQETIPNIAMTVNGLDRAQGTRTSPTRPGRCSP